MKNKPFYEISKDDEKALFDDSIIFFDTSSLLDFFYFTEENINELKSKLFEPLKERLWVSSHTETEFLKNKNKVKLKPVETYNSLINKQKNNNDSGHIQEIELVFTNIKSKIKDELRGHIKTLQEKVSKNNKHPYLKDFDFATFNSQIHDFEKSFQKLSGEFDFFKEIIIKNVEEEKEKIKNNDNVLVTDIIQGFFNVTSDYTFSKLFEITEEGKKRYLNKIPPGYLDDDEKIGFQKYGDLILWKQIIEKCKDLGKNLILVINDVKEDWWYLDDKNKHISPRYELLLEFSENCNKNFWMYDISDFLYKTNEYISTSIDNETIEEIKNITEEYHEPIFEEEFVDWIFDYFELDILYETSSEEEYYDFKGAVNDIVIFQGFFKKLSSPSYTKLMLPIRDFIQSKNDNDTPDILIIEYNNPAIIGSFYNHISHKKTLRFLINQLDLSKKRIIVTLNNEGSYTKIFDSHSV